MDQTNSAANAIVATTITLWGVSTGLTYEVLLAGFAGGLVSLSFLGPMPMWRRIWTPFTATICAGYSAQIGAYYLNKLTEGQVHSLPLLVFSAFAIGVLTQTLIPLGIQWLQRKGQTYEGPRV